MVFAGLVGGIMWNLATWYLGIPSSSSHALIGGVVGSTIAAAGGQPCKWHGLVAKVIIPAVLSPVIAVLRRRGRHLSWSTGSAEGLGRQRVTAASGSARSARASMVSLAHGTNDAQKTMGVITLALIANGTLGRTPRRRRG